MRQSTAAEDARRITTGGGFYFLAPRDTGQKVRIWEIHILILRKFATKAPGAGIRSAYYKTLRTHSQSF